MRSPDAGNLLDIQNAILQIGRYVAGLDQAAFVSDPLRCDAVAMRLIVIGEAAGRLDDAMRQSEAPEIPWAGIVSLRNRIAHGYGRIDHTIVWTQNDLAPLASAVSRMLTARGE